MKCDRVEKQIIVKCDGEMVPNKPDDNHENSWFTCSKCGDQKIICPRDRQEKGKCPYDRCSESDICRWC